MISTVAANHATMTSPRFDTTDVIDRTMDLDVAWTSDGSEGTLQFSVQVGGGETGEVAYVICEFPLADGSASVPSQLLELLPPALASIRAAGVATTEVPVGEWSMSLTLLRYGDSETNVFGRAISTATLE